VPQAVGRLTGSLERLTPAAFFGLCLILLAAFRLPSFVAPLMDTDEAVRAVGAKLILEGRTPYLDFVDNKPPLAFYLYALAGGSLLGARVLAALFTLGTAFVSGALLRREPSGVRRLAAILYLLFSAAWLDRHFLTANTEVFMNLPLAGALWFALPKEQLIFRQFVAGLFTGALFGLAVLIRPTALFAAPVAALFWFLGPREAKDLFTQASVRLGGAVLGGTLVLAGVSLWFLGQGAFREFFFWSFLSGSDIGSTGNAGADFWRRFALSFLPWAAAAGVLWLGAFRVTVRELRVKADGRDYGLLMLAAATAVTVLPCAFGGRWRGHYFLQFLPSLVPLAAVWIGSLAPKLETGTSGPRSLTRPAALAAAVLLPAALALLVNSVNLTNGAHERRIGPEVIALANRWKKTIPENETVFIWGYATGVYLLSEREPASRYIVPVTRISGYAYGSDAQRRGEGDPGSLIDPAEAARLVSDLEKSRPLEIADLAPGGLHGWGCCPMPPALASWVSSRYTLAAPQDRIAVWRRNGSAPPAEAPQGSPVRP